MPRIYFEVRYLVDWLHFLRNIAWEHSLDSKILILIGSKYQLETFEFEFEPQLINKRFSKKNITNSRVRATMLGLAFQAPYFQRIF